MCKCIVCYENTTKTTPTIECGHKIHHKCLLKWKFICNYNNKPLSCPYCTLPIDNMRNTRNRYKNNISSIRTLLNKYYGKTSLTTRSKLISVIHSGNDRCKIITEILKLININTNILYKSERFVKVTQYKVYELQQALKTQYNINRSLKKELNNEFDKFLKNLEIYTPYII